MSAGGVVHKWPDGASKDTQCWLVVYGKEGQKLAWLQVLTIHPFRVKLA